MLNVETNLYMLIFTTELSGKLVLFGNLLPQYHVIPINCYQWILAADTFQAYKEF